MRRHPHAISEVWRVITDSHTTHDALKTPRNTDIEIYVNGALLHRDEPKVSVYDCGFMLRGGIWEGMRLS